jgi:hypothetical protein
MSQKKRYGVYLPITRKEFTPLFLAIKKAGKDIGAEALNCLEERYAAEIASFGKEVLPNGISRKKAGQS